MKENINWDLSDLYSSTEDPEIKKNIEELTSLSIKFKAKYKNSISNLSSSELYDAFSEYEKILSIIYKLGEFAQLLTSIETNNSKYKSFESEIEELSANIENNLVFFDLELGNLPEEKQKQLLSSKKLGNYNYYMHRIFETAQYNLSEKEEQLINIKDLSGTDGWEKMYEELTSNFEFTIKIENRNIKMNGSQLRALRLHPDSNVRKSAMKKLFSKYQENSIAITSAYNNILKDFNLERKLRGYKSSIQVKNIENDLDDKIVSTLHEVTKTSYPLVQRFYSIKKELLNKKTLFLSDIYAPQQKSVKEYDWAETKDIVLNSFRAFDHQFYQIAKQMITEKRIDVNIKQGKRGGAFCSSSTPELKPYILLNHTGKTRDLYTFAHETGHAIHDILCSKQSILNYHPILPMAETASVFSEMLLTDFLLKTSNDKTFKRNLLTEKIQDIFATSHRQNMFSNFEKRTHKKLSEGLLSSKELCSIYKEELQNMFGDVVKITDEYTWEWASIPHIFGSPFYVYAYNFANLIVMALYQQYKEEGESFIPKFKMMLSMGSSASPRDITGLIGIDITDRKFWKKSIKVIESYIDELEKLL